MFAVIKSRPRRAVPFQSYFVLNTPWAREWHFCLSWWGVGRSFAEEWGCWHSLIVEVQNLLEGLSVSILSAL